jgi:hypothetical protein
MLTWIFFFFVAFGSKVVLAFAMIYLIFPSDRAHPHGPGGPAALVDVARRRAAALVPPLRLGRPHPLRADAPARVSFPRHRAHPPRLSAFGELPGSAWRLASEPYAPGVDILDSTRRVVQIGASR